jgi:TolB-like protein
VASVFVSYAREDAAKAKAIASALEQSSFEVWFDERIHSGSEFSREIEQALRAASAVVVLWSKSSVDSPWVRDEAAEGRDSGRLVPISLDECRPPIGFRQFQTTDLSRWSGRGKPKQMADVIAAVAAKAGAPPKPAATTAAVRSPGLRRVALVAAAALIVILAAGAAFLSFRRPADQPNSLSVALLPFDADSSDPDARKLAAAAHDSVAHTLSQGAFAVRAIDSAPQGKAPPGDFLISGQVRSAADKIIATVQMEETQHHVIVFSHQFEANRDASGDFPELVGAQVAAQLSWTAPLIAMERRHPTDPAIIATLLQSSVAGLESGGSLHDYETSRRLAAQAPNSPLAQNNFAFDTAFALDQIPREQRAEAVAAARRAADRTVELAPEYSGAYIPWCLLHSEQRRVECEDRLRTAMRADSDDSFANWFLSRLLNNVGRNREAAELASLSLAHDPYMPYKIGHALRMLELTGQSSEAAELYQQARHWWPQQPILYWNRQMGMLDRGDFQAAERFEHDAGPQLHPKERLPPLSAGVKSRSVGAVRGACAKLAPDDPNETPCMLAYGLVGDLDSAFRIADRLYPSRRGRTPADEERIWLDDPDAAPLAPLTGPAAAPLRRDPRFLALADRVGLLEYWRSGRLPDFCRDKPEPICPQLVGRR